MKGHGEKSLPRHFASHPLGADILAEADIFLTKRSRLAAKLIIFKTVRGLSRFWRGALGHSLGKRCYGAVNPLRAEVWTFHKDGRETRRVESDPRYFCIIGLTARNLTMEVITHEATHAAFAYVECCPRRFWTHPSEMPQERFCYPAGKVARAINSFVHEKGLYR